MLNLSKTIKFHKGHTMLAGNWIQMHISINIIAFLKKFKEEDLINE